MVGVVKRHAVRVRLACWPGTLFDQTHHASCVRYLFFILAACCGPGLLGAAGRRGRGGSVCSRWCRVFDEGGTERGGEGEGHAAPPNAAGMTLPVATRTMCFLYCECCAVLPLLWSGAEGTVSASTLRASLPPRAHRHIQTAPRVWRRLLGRLHGPPQRPPAAPPALTAAELGRRTWAHPRRPGWAAWQQRWGRFPTWRGTRSQDA